MVERNDEGRIVVLRPVLDKEGRPLTALEPTRQYFPATTTLGVTYATTGGELLVRWLVLAGFSVLFLVVGGLALNRSESF
jgi:hypothetical protein